MIEGFKVIYDVSEIQQLKERTGFEPEEDNRDDKILTVEMADAVDAFYFWCYSDLEPMEELGIGFDTIRRNAYYWME